VVRLTNLMSVLETLYSGDTVLLVFPDGTGPALLSCLIAGIPLNKVHELQFQPGEIRFDVNYDSINALASSSPSQTYLDKLQRGRDELKQLRENPDLLRNVKDLEYEKELERENREQEAKKKEEAQVMELERRKEKEKAKKEKEEREAKRKEDARAREVEQQRKREEMRRAQQLKKKEEDANQNSTDGSDESNSSMALLWPLRLCRVILLEEMKSRKSSL